MPQLVPREFRAWKQRVQPLIVLVTAYGTAILLYRFSASTAKVGGDGTLTVENMNPRLRDMEYAVRGSVPLRAREIAEEIREAASQGKPNQYNFSKLLHCNIGNPQAVGQKPVTWYRQVLSLVDSPHLLGLAMAGKLRGVFPADVIDRAKWFSNLGSTGAYSESQGLLPIRRDVCNFIEARDDGPPCEARNIFLVNGASAGIQSVLTALIAGPQDAILVPVPQYPIYSALITLLGGRMVEYYLDEENGWGLSIEELQGVISNARKEGLNPRALVLINPGNPTGQVFSEDDLRAVVQICMQENLMLLADEVYQENVYASNAKFVSARKVAAELAKDTDDVPLQLVSFHSTSKGLIGECGRRGGYMELWNIDPGVHAQLYKLQSSQLCPNLDGQVMTGLMVRPPVEGEPSYRLFAQESAGVFESLRRKADAVTRRLHEVTGITCNVAAGAMYAFPRIDLPLRAMEEADARNMAPDLLYCLSLLEATGVVTVPGSGFGQKPGQWHLRIAFLPPEDELLAALDAFALHHDSFMAKYG